LKFSVDSKVFNKFPDLGLGVVVVKDIDNRDPADALFPLIMEEEEKIRANYSTEILLQLPKIVSWRKAYLSFGAKPKKYKSSVESLYRMILKGINLRHINTLVDIYNYISIKHMIPAGGDDLSRVEGDITLRFARGGEPFRALNSEVLEQAKEGEVIYADDVEVLCRRWNWRECDKTKMTDATETAILVVEGLPPVGKEEVADAVEDLSDLIRRFCGGESHTDILSADHREPCFGPFT
jgi:DNA/RNA-binding domain of Phe-tRNA-synthetase-like protein